MTTPRVLAVLGVAMALTMGIVRARHPSAAEAEKREPAIGVRLKKGDVLPSFALTTQTHRPFTEAALRGRVTAVTFIYTRCPVPNFCPLMSKGFHQLQREIEREPALRDAQLLSVTLDPKFDTPEVLDAYAKHLGADPKRWHFVTGSPAEIDRLTRAFSIHMEPNGVLIDHTLATAVIDADGRIVEIWRGNGWTVAEVIAALRKAPAVL